MSSPFAAPPSALSYDNFRFLPLSKITQDLMSAPSVNETFGASRQPLLPPLPGTPLPTRHPMFPPTQSLSRRSDGDQTVCQIGFTISGTGRAPPITTTTKTHAPPAVRTYYVRVRAVRLSP